MTVFTVCRKYAKYDQYKNDMHDMHNTQIFKKYVKTLQNHDMQYYHTIMHSMSSMQYANYVNEYVNSMHNMSKKYA